MWDCKCHGVVLTVKEVIERLKISLIDKKDDGNVGGTRIYV